jgi:transposase
LDLRAAWACKIEQALARLLEIADPAEAMPYLKCWGIWATHSWLRPVIHLARIIKTHLQGIINLIDAQVPNGMVEGLNLKIKTAIERA